MRAALTRACRTPRMPPYATTVAGRFCNHRLGNKMRAGGVLGPAARMTATLVAPANAMPARSMAVACTATADRRIPACTGYRLPSRNTTGVSNAQSSQPGVSPTSACQVVIGRPLRRESVSQVVALSNAGTLHKARRAYQRRLRPSVGGWEVAPWRN